MTDLTLLSSNRAQPESDVTLSTASWLPSGRLHVACTVAPAASCQYSSSTHTKPVMLRKGESGASSELLTAQQQRQVDDFCRSVLQELGSDFPYDELYGHSLSLV